MAPRERLDGLKQISQYLQLHKNQVRKFYGITVPRDIALPIFVLTPVWTKGSKLYAWKHELDAWQARMAQRSFEAASWKGKP